VYYYWPYTNAYERADESLALDPRYWEVAIRPGLGKYYWSDYRTGITGLQYLERMGIIYDKYTALDYLTNRFTGLPYTIDEAYFVNFYDAFPDEMSYLFGNFATQQLERIMPRLTLDAEGQPNIQYLDLWRGTCDYREGQPCRGDPDADYTGTPHVEDGTHFLMQMYSAIESLAQFPVYWDATWERQLRLYVEGGVDGVEINDCADVPDDPDCLVEGVDYVRFVSERFHRSYLALAVDEDSEGRRGESYIYDMLSHAVELQENIAELQACIDANEHDLCGYEHEVYRNAVLRDWTWELDDIEGYVRYFLQIQRDYGINTWMGW
jgi:hypothetical protein